MLSDRIQKLYNIQTETYRICKDSLITLNDHYRSLVIKQTDDDDENENYANGDQDKNNDNDNGGDQEDIIEDKIDLNNNKNSKSNRHHHYNRFFMGLSTLSPFSVSSASSGSISTAATTFTNSNSDPMIVVSNGMKNNDKKNKRNKKKKNNNQQPTNMNEHEEHEAMMFVISTVTNHTLERYQSLMEQKMSEEFNVLRYEIKERFDIGDDRWNKHQQTTKTNIITPLEKLASDFTTLKEQIEDGQNLLESKLDRSELNQQKWAIERAEEERAMLAMMVNKANEKPEQQQKLLKQEGRTEEQAEKEVFKGHCGNVDGQETMMMKMMNSTIKTLFDVYINKIILKQSNSYNKNNESTVTTIERQPKEFQTDKNNDENEQQQHFTVPKSTSAPSPPKQLSKQSIDQNKRKEFITILATELPQELDQENLIKSESNQSHSIAKIKDRSATKIGSGGLKINKPEFKPIKMTNYQRLSCTTNSAISYPKSCAELREHGATCDGVYVTIMQKFALKHVYCDMHHLNGGWTVCISKMGPIILKKLLTIISY